MARSNINPYQRQYALMKVAGALARTGQHEQAETVAGSITDRHQQAKALAEIARASNIRRYGERQSGGRSNLRSRALDDWSDSSDGSGTVRVHGTSTCAGNRLKQFGRVPPGVSVLGCDPPRTGCAELPIVRIADGPMEIRRPHRARASHIA